MFKEQMAMIPHTFQKDQSGKKTIRIWTLDGQNKRRKYNAPQSFPDKYCRFTLTKTNYESMAAVGMIAKYLQRRPKNFGFAGTKDKRGITTQHVTIYQCLGETLDQK